MSFFLSELQVYTGRIREFSPQDWRTYVLWVGTMSGLFLSTLVFALVGLRAGAPMPAMAWLVPVGALIFTVAIAVDTIGHRTIYREALRRAEGFVHHITIFCGVTSCLLLCLTYSHRALLIPSFVLTALSFLYSLVDEGFHWHRYWSHRSDVVEMWSHVFILLGHATMMAAWLWWAAAGYPGVRETLRALQGA